MATSESLPLKYRPQRFEDLVGQDVLARYLSSLIKRGQVAKHLIVYGQYGSGKTSSSRIYTRALNCLAPNEETGSPCNECDNCKAFFEKRYTDYLEVDGATSGRIEKIKEIQDIATTPPMFGQYRILLIDEAQGLSKQAWDVLLKIIEEPPPYLCFIFTTTEVDKVRPAIRSRCQTLEVQLLTHPAAVTHLKHVCKEEGFHYEDAALDLIAYVSKGHPRDLLKNLEQCAMFDDLTVANVAQVLNLGFVTHLMKFFRAFQQKDLAGMKKSLEDWGDSPQRILQTLQEFLVFLLYATVKNTGVVVNPVFEAIPKSDLHSVYNWFIQHASPAIEGGMATAFLNVVRAISSTPASTSVSLDIVIHSLYNLAYEHGFNTALYGKASNKVQQTAATQGEQKKRPGGRQFTTVHQAANAPAQPPAVQPPPVQPQPAAQPVQPTQPAAQPAEEKPVYGHTLLQSGFSLAGDTSDIVSL